MNLRAVVLFTLASLVLGRADGVSGATLVSEGAKLSQPTATKPTNAVAVADFDVVSAHRSNDDWAFGLADVLAAELQRCDVVLFERQQMRVILGERKITASGLLQLRAGPAHAIPDLHYLVTGNIRSLTNRQFQLEASLVEARTGRGTASFSRTGHYPEELASSLTGLANELAGHLKSAGAIREHEVVASTQTTRTPEISLLFYRGVDYCLAGQPEIGVTWFIDAQKAAPNFLPARLWTIRAFEMLGLADFAEVARAHLRALPGKPGALEQKPTTTSIDQWPVSVAVISDPALNGAGQQLQAALRLELGRHTNVFVADPGNIRALAAEMDLQLTEKDSHDLELTSALWSTLDAFVRVSAELGQLGQFKVELRDALSGEVLLRTACSSNLADANQLGQKLVQQLGNERTRSTTAVNEPRGRRTRAVKPVQVSNTDRNEFAGLLKYLAEKPADRSGWMRLSLFFPWLSGRTDGGYECAMFNRIIAATTLTEADAAHWLSSALWRKRAYGCAPNLVVDAAVLLEHFPRTPEGQYARSALALELIEQKKYTEAAAILLQLADELPRLPASIKIEPDFWANFYFFTALALHETGDDVRARPFLDKADAVLRQNPDMLVHDGNTYQLGVWVNHFPVSHPLFGPGREIRQAVAEWEARLEPVSFTSGRQMSLEQLELLLTQTKEIPVEQAWSNRVVFLQRLTEHKQANLALYQGRITESAWKGAYRKVEGWPQGWCYGYFSLPGKLVMEANAMLHKMAFESPKRIEETRRWAVVLADQLDPQVAANCFEAVGEFQRALEKVEEAMRSPSPFPPLSIGMHPTREQMANRELRREKIRILQSLGKSSDAADYARQQARRPQADADAQFAAVMDAVDACKAIRQPDEVCQLLAEFVRNQESAGTMTSQSAAARIHWADQEIARQNLFEATDILRTVTKEAEGKDWGVSLRNTGYTKVYNAAIARLDKLRASSVK